MEWDKLDEEAKITCYESYVEDIIYESGDSAQYLTYDKWCEESKKFGEPLGPCI